VMIHVAGVQVVQMKVIINAYSIRTISCERIVQLFFLLIICFLLLSYYVLGFPVYFTSVHPEVIMRLQGH
jgi:hypothetical protein